jgi:hypothetical protein
MRRGPRAGWPLVVLAAACSSAAADQRDQVLFDTGLHEPMLLDGMPTSVAWLSADLCVPDCETGLQQWRTAQAFALPAADHEWRVLDLVIDGFDPGTGVNESLNYAVFAREGTDRPEPVDMLVEGLVPFPVTGEYHIAVDFTLPPGEYWLSVWASNASQVSASFAWFTNAPDGINLFCPPRDCVGPPSCGGSPTGGCNPDECTDTEGTVMMWWTCTWPPGPDGFGYGSSVLPSSMAPDPDNDPTPDWDDLLNAAFRIVGMPACPWDCGDDDGEVDVVDFLALLAEWNQVATPCDVDGDGVGVNDFLSLLAHWGPCP